METLNALLDSLSSRDKDSVMEKCAWVFLPYQQILFEETQPLTHVWFPVTTVLSLMNVMDDGQAIEVTTVGNEGVLGLVGLFGEHSVGRSIVQVAGNAYKISLHDFKGFLSSSASLREAMDAFTHLFLYQIVKTAGCNALHSVETRCARWLLTMQERRAQATDHYEMTQEFLAEMLGCRRQTVTVICHKFQKQGLIDYRYGIMKILDRPRLEAGACECYRKIKRERARVRELQRLAA